MMSFFNRLFGRRSRGFGGFGRRRRGQRGGIALGSLAALAAPFILRKVRSRREQRAYADAY